VGVAVTRISTGSVCALADTANRIARKIPRM